MQASLIDGKVVSTNRRDILKRQIHQHIQSGYNVPGLAVILIGNDPASTIYVNNKRKACAEVGITSYFYELPTDTAQKTLEDLIDNLNHDKKIDGILMQLPLPTHMSESHIIERIKPTKDVDGFHPYNIGRLAQKNPLLRPCTPLGIINLLNHYDLAIKGKHAVVVGVSNIVGRPLGLELLLSGATVSMCHRFTNPLKHLVQQADILIVATGVQDVVDPSWLHDKQIVIDVGIHRLSNNQLRGDVQFEQARNKVAWITPVPGGVGPMTVTTLLENTFLAANLQLKQN